MNTETKTNKYQMPKQSRDDYLKSLIIKTKYHSLTKKQKGRILDEYCKNTNQNRNYVIRKIKSGKYLLSKEERRRRRKRRRSSKYGEEIKAPLVQLWKMFDCPCGQRLVTSLADEVDRLRNFGELKCSDMVVDLLKQISARSIDYKLKDQKEKELLRKKYQAKKLNKPLYQNIPIKIASDQTKHVPGFTQADLVEHCGGSLSGSFIHSLNFSDLFSGWNESEALARRSQITVSTALDNIKDRLPFTLSEIHIDNDSVFMNYHLYRYTKKEKIRLSRSRPYKKNDNFLVEQKNWTHIRKLVGYLRYDTKEELNILKDLYRNELRLYNNYFQPHIKLISKYRINGRIKRKYDKPKTPHRRLMDSKYISEKTKKELQKTYESLNPAELKRKIDYKVKLLLNAYQSKQSNHVYSCSTTKRIKPSLKTDIDKISLTFLNCTTR